MKSFVGSMAARDTIQMRVLIRNWKTGLYFQTPDIWSNDRLLATDFEHVTIALEETIKQAMTDIEIVLAFPNPKLDVRVKPC